MNGDWFVAELLDGSRLKGRMHMEAHAKSGMYPFRIEMHWKKTDDEETDNDLTAKAEEQLTYIFEKERDAFLVLVKEETDKFVYTWYVRNLQHFGERLNQVLMLFPPLPLTLYSMDDPDWDAYTGAQKVLNSI